MAAENDLKRRQMPNVNKDSFTLYLEVRLTSQNAWIHSLRNNRERGLVSADFGMDDVCCCNSVAYLTCLTMFEIVQIFIFDLLGQNLKLISLDLFTPHFLAKTAALCLR